MNSIDYIGFDIHKKTISFCAKAQDGRILDEGTIPARRTDLSAWAQAAQQTVVGRDGSDAVYGMGLRSPEAFGAGVEGGAPGDAQGDRGIQEEERQGGRAQDRRSAAL